MSNFLIERAVRYNIRLQLRELHLTPADELIYNNDAFYNRNARNIGSNSLALTKKVLIRLLGIKFNDSRFADYRDNIFNRLILEQYEFDFNGYFSNTRTPENRLAFSNVDQSNMYHYVSFNAINSLPDEMDPVPQPIESNFLRALRLNRNNNNMPALENDNHNPSDTESENSLILIPFNPNEIIVGNSSNNPIDLISNSSNSDTELESSINLISDAEMSLETIESTVDYKEEKEEKIFNDLNEEEQENYLFDLLNEVNSNFFVNLEMENVWNKVNPIDLTKEIKTPKKNKVSRKIDFDDFESPPNKRRRLF